MTCPLWVAHGQKDDTLPYQQAEQLFAASAASEKKFFEMTKSQDHDDLDPKWIAKLAAFTKVFREKSRRLPPIPDVTAYSTPPCDLAKREAEQQRRVRRLNALKALEALETLEERCHDGINFVEQKYEEAVVKSCFETFSWGQKVQPESEDDPESNPKRSKRSKTSGST